MEISRQMGQPGKWTSEGRLFQGERTAYAKVQRKEIEHGIL